MQKLRKKFGAAGSSIVMAMAVASVASGVVMVVISGLDANLSKVKLEESILLTGTQLAYLERAIYSKGGCERTLANGGEYNASTTLEAVPSWQQRFTQNLNSQIITIAGAIIPTVYDSEGRKVLETYSDTNSNGKVDRTDQGVYGGVLKISKIELSSFSENGGYGKPDLIITLARKMANLGFTRDFTRKYPIDVLLRNDRISSCSVDELSFKKYYCNQILQGIREEATGVCKSITVKAIDPNSAKGAKNSVAATVNGDTLVDGNVDVVGNLIVGSQTNEASTSFNGKLEIGKGLTVFKNLTVENVNQIESSSLINKINGDTTINGGLVKLEKNFKLNKSLIINNGVLQESGNFEVKGSSINIGNASNINQYPLLVKTDASVDKSITFDNMTVSQSATIGKSGITNTAYDLELTGSNSSVVIKEMNVDNNLTGAAFFKTDSSNPEKMVLTKDYIAKLFSATIANGDFVDEGVLSSFQAQSLNIKQKFIAYFLNNKMVISNCDGSKILKEINRNSGKINFECQPDNTGGSTQSWFPGDFWIWNTSQNASTCGGARK
jgi:hypothetical protein